MTRRAGSQPHQSRGMSARPVPSSCLRCRCAGALSRRSGARATTGGVHRRPPQHVRDQICDQLVPAIESYVGAMRTHPTAGGRLRAAKHVNKLVMLAVKMDATNLIARGCECVGGPTRSAARCSRWPSTGACRRKTSVGSDWPMNWKRHPSGSSRRLGTRIPAGARERRQRPARPRLPVSLTNRRLFRAARSDGLFFCAILEQRRGP